jgi:hypothetical protein
LRAGRVGVVAFSRWGDADAGEYDEPVILAQHGELPLDMP